MFVQIGCSEFCNSLESVHNDLNESSVFDIILNDAVTALAVLWQTLCLPLL